MRYRTRGGYSQSKYTVSDYNPPCPGTLASQTVNINTGRQASGTFETISDVVTPNFKKLKAQGAVIMNPVTKTTDTRESVESNWSLGCNPQWGKRTFAGTMACEWSDAPTRPSWFDTRINDSKPFTLNRAYSNIAQSDFLALVTVAEAFKTATMIANPFARAEALIKQIVTRRDSLRKKGHTAARALATAWLEYRLGWKPLLYDIEGIWDAWIANTQYYDRPTRLVARSKNEIVYKDSQVYTPSRMSGLTGCTFRRTMDWKAKVTSGVLYELHEDSLEIATARRMGLRLSDVPASIWELVPFSFVVDRFVDVGNWLNAITPKPGCTVKGNWTTVTKTESNYHEVINAYVQVGSPLTRYDATGGSYKETFVNYTRTVNGVQPFSPPVNPKDLTHQQSLDHAALLVELLSGLGFTRK